MNSSANKVLCSLLCRLLKLLHNTFRMKRRLRNVDADGSSKASPYIKYSRVKANRCVPETTAFCGVLGKKLSLRHFHYQNVRSTKTRTGRYNQKSKLGEQ
uniref:Uncharacterized protein n=1 Tax=Physcomitrium patens TaxID=3218 RepID=A0A2K1JRB1_PHYPA|nr:hypothetical protein PHYPA_016453 [Physcomitrium patens]